MALTVGFGFQSGTLNELYTDDRVAGIFSGQQQLATWLRVEGALARAQGGVGVIPKSAADEISAVIEAGSFDLGEYCTLAKAMLHPIMPVIDMLQRRCSRETAEYVHWGATTQDIIDTAMVLQMIEAHIVIRDRLHQVARSLAEFAGRYCETRTVGRTNGQIGSPLPLGFKAAATLDELVRSLRHVNQAAEEMRVVQLGGGVGTLASLGERGLAVRQAFADELGLVAPTITWHVARDRIVRYCLAVSILISPLKRFAKEVINLSRSEIQELEFGWGPTQVGSSAMPHKRNPWWASLVISLVTTAIGHSNDLLGCMLQEHERDRAVWQTEWDAVPSSLVYASRAAEAFKTMFAGVEGNVAKIEVLLRSYQGSLASEAATMKLAAAIGKKSARDRVSAAAEKALEERREMSELIVNELASIGLNGTELENWFDKNPDLSLAVQMTRAVVEQTIEAIRRDGHGSDD